LYVYNFESATENSPVGQKGTEQMKKLFALALAALMLFCVSCKKDGGKTNDGNVSGEYEISDYTSDLWVEDYDGYNFRILVRPSYVSDQYLEEDSDDPVESAVYKRNKTIEEMFNITISANLASTDNYETDALNPILAGDDAYDMILCHNGAAFTYANQGAAVNLNDVDTIHLEKPWWSQDMVEGCNLGGNLYVLDGDISMHRVNYAMCLFFNKNIFDELGLEYPYEMVEYGEWTFDEFEELVKQGARDLDGDGLISPENDRMGLITSHWTMPIAVIYTGGQRIYTKNEEGYLDLTLNTMKTVDIYDAYFDLTSQEGVLLCNNKETRGAGVFEQGRALFTDGSLGSAKTKRNMEDDFGIVPLPKFEYDDEYATVTNGMANLMVMPITVEDESRTGAIIEALCAIGSRDVLPAFYDQSLKTKFSRDNESEVMIDIIKDSLVYDVGYATGAFNYIGNVLANKESPDFSSHYAASEGSALNKLEGLNESYAGLEADD